VKKVQSVQMISLEMVLKHQSFLVKVEMVGVIEVEGRQEHHQDMQELFCF